MNTLNIAFVASVTWHGWSNLLPRYGCWYSRILGIPNVNVTTKMMAGRGHVQLNGKGMVFPISMKLSLFRCKRKEENLWKCLHWTLNHGWGLVFFTFTTFHSVRSNERYKKGKILSGLHCVMETWYSWHSQSSDLLQVKGLNRKILVRCGQPQTWDH